MRWMRFVAPLPPTLLGLVLLTAVTPATCQGPTSGPRQFGEDTIVIPMDECWQPYSNSNNATDGDIEPPSGNGLGGSCSTTYTMGALYAYGLVYNLIAQGVTVYWAISPTRTNLTDVDFSVPGAAQGTLYDFSAASAHGAANGTAITSLGQGTSTHECAAAGLCYRGGPFVIDGADFTTVYNLLSTNPNFSQFAGNVQLHVLHPSNAVTVPVNRTLVGTPPKIAILATPDVNCFQTAPILDQYLLDAALSQQAGTVYQNLYAGDFDVDGGSLANATLNGFNLLWIPHYASNDGSADGLYGYTDTTQGNCTTRMTATQADNLMSVVGQFVAAGGNLFAECAGIGAMEGDDGYDSENNLSASTEFLTDDGNGVVSHYQASAQNMTFSAPASPFLQIGDFPFVPAPGFVGGFSGNYYTSEQSLVTDQNGNDVLDVIPSGGGLADAGTVLYLGGHAYTNYADPSNHTTFQQNVAGERMVLNTLLSLAATCSAPTADGGSCSTGLPGVCQAGLWQCTSGGLTCVQQVMASPEVCDGLDNDCDGLVDDNIAPRACYRGASGTADCHGQASKDAGYRCGCHPGLQLCVNGVFGTCEGEADPSSEVCNGIDDDCDGRIDNLADSGLPLSEPCYDGPPGTEGVGLCKGGTAVCTGGAYPTCAGQQTPVYGQCDGLDHSCIGMPNLCNVCQPNQTRPCYDGPSGTLGVGLCTAGQQTCVDGGWPTDCPGEVLPADGGGFCDGKDHACNNQPDVCTACTPGDSRPCYTGPSGTQGVGICKGGTQTCDQSGNWGGCLGEVLPAPQTCDGLDNTCRGQIDVGAKCPALMTCVNGVCVSQLCGGESGFSCPDGYFCQSGACILTTCGDGGDCAPGQACVGGACQNPCEGVTCGSGSICAGGQCIAGGCTSSGCGDAGAICVQGLCQGDPCTGVACADGTFCRAGLCVQACAFLNCPSGQSCDFDGQCVAAPCGGACSAGQVCQNGTCGTDPCKGVSCAQGQVCQLGNCLDDPCADVHCPGLLACLAGQCVDALRDGGSFPGGGSSGGASSGGASGGTSGTSGTAGATNGSGTGANSSAGGTGGTKSSSGGCGCSSGGDPLAAWPAVMALGLLAPRRRSRAKQQRRASRSPHWPWSAVLAAVVGLGACISNGSPGGTSGSATGTTTVGLIGGNSTGSFPSASSSGGSGGCALCGSACVLLASDPNHCGSCSNVCQSGEVCLFGACGPEGAIAPELDSLSPSSGSFGTLVPVTLTGARFSNQSRVRIAGNGLPADDTQTAAFIDPQHLSFTLDLTTIVGGTLQLSVINPGQVTSNSLPFTVTAPGSPQLLTVTPGAAPTGAPVTLTFAGSGLNAGCEIHVEGGALTDQPLPTDGQTGTSASATWDLTQVAPGNYSFYALNPGAPPSNSLSFVVQSGAPTLSAVSPQTAPTNALPELTLTGTGFDSSSVVYFGSSPSAALAQTTTYVSPTELYGSLDLTNVLPGSYVLLVQNSGGLRSTTKPFTVSSVAPQVSSVAPSQGAEGDMLTLMVSGEGFNASSTVHFQGSNALDLALATTYVSGGSLTALLDLTGRSPGGYTIVVENPGNPPSTPVGFTVTSNAPSLTGLSPAALAQDSGQQSLTLTGTNLVTGATVTLTQVSGGSAVFTLSLTAAAGGVSGTVSFDPSTEPVGDYLVTPAGGNASSPVPFAIQPGTPTIDQLSPTSSSQTTANVSLCGLYYVAGLSTVHTSGLNLTDQVVPSTLGPGTGCPAGADQALTASLDLTTASPGAYTVTVWNGPSLKSNVQTFTVTGP